MTDLLIGTITYNVAWAAGEQIRLFAKHLRDDYQLRVYDNSSDEGAAAEIRAVCGDETPYARLASASHLHHLALNAAVADMLATGSAYVGVIDHDIFPTEPTSLIPKINVAGFYGLGQTHTPRMGPARRYLWPGFAFFARDWLAGRTLNFEGVRAEHDWDDGDTGSMLHTLFSTEDWERMPGGGHSYGLLREEDEHGLQSYGYERVADSFIHFTNLSRWKQVPDPDAREALVREMVEAL